MSKNTGKKYEEFVHRIYSILKDRDRCSVKLNVDLDSPEGTRQIDVLICEKHHCGIELTCAIECRDYTRRLDIGHIDAFHSKLQDINVDRGIIVSRIGCTKGAAKKAERVGIEVCMANDLSSLLKTLQLKMPAKLNLIRSTIRASYDLHIKHRFQTIRTDATHVISDIDLHKCLHDELLSGQLPLPLNSCEIDWRPKLPYLLNSIRDNLGNKIYLNNLKLSAIFNLKWFYGYLNDFSFLSAHHVVNTSEIKIVGNLGDWAWKNILPHLTEYSAPENRPDLCHGTINLIDMGIINNSLPHTYQEPGIYRLNFIGKIPK